MLSPELGEPVRFSNLLRWGLRPRDFRRLHHRMRRRQGQAAWPRRILDEARASTRMASGWFGGRRGPRGRSTPSWGFSMIRSVTSHHAVRRLAIGGLVVLLAVAAVACGGGKKSGGGSQPQTFDVTTATATSTEAAASPSPEATAAAPAFPAPAADAKIMRLVIPAAKVDAPLQVKGLNARNEMENPDGKDNVAWYDFTGRPGFGSNAVFSGHVDWFTGQQGVFWYLRDLKAGDEVIVRMTDGSELHYR